jgi:predicted 3-demethylubiquinone-9 3-methyltransferase (glyoxalase superfamily)
VALRNGAFVERLGPGEKRCHGAVEQPFLGRSELPQLGCVTAGRSKESPMSKITPCLWFDGNAEAAAKFYVSLFPDSHVDAVHRAPSDYPSGKAGDVLLVEFTLMGQPFTALNGGPMFRFNEAVSFQIPVETQAEVDRFTNALSAVPEAEQCGWVKDRFGVSWQIVPRPLMRLIGGADPGRAKRAFDAMMQMKRIDIAALERAADGIAPSS